MKNIYIFDIDGTLTEPRQQVSEAMHSLFYQFCTKHENDAVYLVTGSDYPKVEEQVGNMAAYIDGVFTCSGNEFWHGGNRVWTTPHLELPSEMMNMLTGERIHSEYRDQASKPFEPRPGMMNFSTVGRNASQLVRDSYEKWDSEYSERFKIAENLMTLFPDYVAHIGGQISIDIMPVGKDKSQILRYLLPMAIKHGSRVVFVGDRLIDGNDEPLRRVIEKIPLPNLLVNVTGPSETAQFMVGECR